MGIGSRIFLAAIRITDAKYMIFIYSIFPLWIYGFDLNNVNRVFYFITEIECFTTRNTTKLQNFANIIFRKWSCSLVRDTWKKILLSKFYFCRFKETWQHGLVKTCKPETPIFFCCFQKKFLIVILIELFS